MSNAGESNKFWKGVIYDKNGKLDEKQVLKELADFYFIMQEVPEVYCRITGNQMSKLMYKADDVITLFEQYNLNKEITQDDVMDMIKNCTDLEELKEELIEYFDLKERYAK